MSQIQGAPEADEPVWNRPDAPPPDWGHGQRPGPLGAWQPVGPAIGGWTPPPPPPPYGAPASYGQPYTPYGEPPTRGTSTLAIVALVLSVLCGPLGVLSGILAHQHARQRGMRGAGIALAAIVVGVIWVVAGIVAVWAGVRVATR